LQQGISSLIVAIIAYFIMVNPYSEHLVLVFPELLLILLAGNLLIGRYSGFRLCDLPRFRMLAGRNL
ncbi:MAG: 7TM domain-containing protein, partial [Pseudomonadota bacterium]